MLKKLFLLAAAALILTLPGPAWAGAPQRPLQQGGGFDLYLPVVPKAPPLAALEITNETGGDVRVEIHGVGMRIFAPGTSTWFCIDVAAGWYTYTATALGGPCAGQSLSGTFWLEKGQTTRETFI